MLNAVTAPKTKAMRPKKAQKVTMPGKVHPTGGGWKADLPTFELTKADADGM